MAQMHFKWLLSGGWLGHTFRVYKDRAVGSDLGLGVQGFGVCRRRISSFRWNPKPRWRDCWMS